MMKPSHRLLVVLVLLALVAVLQISAFWDLRTDDGYITYRYAENLARGEGPVYNPGERIQGSTAPGHLLIASAMVHLTGHTQLPTAMAVLGCLAWLAQAVIVWFLLRPALGPLGAGAVAAMLAVGAPRPFLWVGLETNLVTALALAAILCAHRGRWTAAAAFAAAAGLTRPDAYLLTLILAVPCLLATRRAVWRPALAWSLIALPWPLFATLYYGSPIPHTAQAKVAFTPLGTYVEQQLVRLPAERVLPWLGTLAPYLGFFLVVLGTVLLLRRDRRLWPLPVWGLAHAAAYAVLRPPPGHSWHVYPWMVVFAVLFTAGLAVFSTPPAPRWRRLVVGVVLVGLIGGWTLVTVEKAGTHRAETFIGARDRAYRAVASYLREHGSPDDVVASREIGAIGYWSGLRVHDMMGLITLDRELPWHDPSFRWLILRPHVWRAMQHDQRLAGRYQIRYHGFSVVIFERVDFSQARSTRP